jgi:hypothetical protein
MTRFDLNVPDLLGYFIPNTVVDVRLGRGVDAKSGKTKGRKPSGCGLHHVVDVPELFGQSGQKHST